MLRKQTFIFVLIVKASTGLKLLKKYDYLNTSFTKNGFPLSPLSLTLSRRRSLSNANQSFNLLCLLMNWFLYDKDFHYDRVQLRKPTIPN